MVRYYLRCKNSLLLLKRKSLLRVGDKNLFFLLNSRFYFILFLFIYTVLLVFDVSQISVPYKYVLWAHPTKARR
jgi:hypothetical protein